MLSFNGVFLYRLLSEQPSTPDPGGALQRLRSHHRLWQLRGLYYASRMHVQWVSDKESLLNKDWYVNCAFISKFSFAETFKILDKDKNGTVEFNFMEVGVFVSHATRIDMFMKKNIFVQLSSRWISIFTKWWVKKDYCFITLWLLF